MTATEKALFTAKILDEKKASDVKILKVSEKTVIADYFVIASADSTTHTKALADEAEYRLGQENEKVYSKEGADSANWILLDLGDVIVHIFDERSREFFKLEKLWCEAEDVPFDKKED